MPSASHRAGRGRGILPYGTKPVCSLARISRLASSTAAILRRSDDGPCPALGRYDTDNLKGGWTLAGPSPRCRLGSFDVSAHGVLTSMAWQRACCGVRVAGAARSRAMCSPASWGVRAQPLLRYRYVVSGANTAVSTTAVTSTRPVGGVDERGDACSAVAHDLNDPPGLLVGVADEADLVAAAHSPGNSTVSGMWCSNVRPSVRRSTSLRTSSPSSRPRSGSLSSIRARSSVRRDTSGFGHSGGRSRAGPPTRVGQPIVASGRPGN